MGRDCHIETENTKCAVKILDFHFKLLGMLYNYNL